MSAQETEVSETPTVETNSTAGTNASDSTPMTVGGGKNVVMPNRAFTERLRKAEDKGAKKVAAEWEEKAKKLGFSSWQDAFDTLAALKSAQGQAPKSNAGGKGKPNRSQDLSVETQVQPNREEFNDNRQQNNNNSNNYNNNNQQNNNQRYQAKDTKRWEAQLDRERKARETERRARLHEERRRKDAEHAREALEAESAIREQAIMAGVKDVDYAVTLLRRNIDGKSADELKGFDELKFFDDLRERQPYLFGERSVSVTTGTGVKEPGAPKPGQIAQGTAANGQIDATKMNNKEFAEHLRKRGLNLNISGV